MLIIELALLILGIIIGAIAIIGAVALVICKIVARCIKEFKPNNKES